ncbi:MAG: CBS domain-containing protein [Mycobacteriales bacterium]
MISLQEFLTPAVTCRPEATLAQAAIDMDRHNVGSILVLDADGTIAGIATDRDIALRGTGRELPPITRITEVMTPEVVMLRWDADLFDAASMMAASECRRLPVVDESGVLKGIVTLDDLMVLFAHQTDSLASAVAAEMSSH